MTEFQCPHCGARLTVTAAQPGPAKTLAQIKALFPHDLEEMLTFEDSGDCYLVKPRQFLGSDTFAKIAAIIREAQGEYIRAGKDSHFRIPK